MQVTELNLEECELIERALRNYRIMIGDERRQRLIVTLADTFESATAELRDGGSVTFKGIVPERKR